MKDRQNFRYRHGARSVSLNKGIRDTLADILDSERARWLLWTPVFFGTGIGLYFALQNEPSIYVGPALVLAASGLCLASRARPFIWLASCAFLFVALGFATISAKTAAVKSPFLFSSDRHAKVTAWVEAVEKRDPKGARLLLRPIEISRLDATKTPYRVRITSRFEIVPKTGDAVTLRAVLKPVPPPVMPHGFDFARKAYFARIGAVGFATSAPVPAEPAISPPATIQFRSIIDGVRADIDDLVTESLPSQASAIVVALITGDRGRIPDETMQALRSSGLAHMLAISGMHMALMAGTLYWLVRAAAAAIPALALKFKIKKWAAICALFGAAIYLAISGGAIATQRAFLMMAIVFIAILLDRPALTLRNVAIAALLILSFYPESLLDVSFQMSFAAVTALIAVYERLAKHQGQRPTRSLPVQWVRQGGRYLGGIALTTLVASIAIAPFAAFHFHKLAQFSLLANLAAMPVFGLVVMPMALASLLSMPFGLETYPLQFMAIGVDWIIQIASTVSSWKGAIIPISTMPVISLLALVSGGLWLTLWQTRWRYLGLPIAAIGALAAGNNSKPDLLLSRDGKFLAMRTAEDTLSIAGTHRKNYSIEKWLIADGNEHGLTDALRSGAFSCDELACVGKWQKKNVSFILHPAAITEECARSDVIISRVAIREKCKSARVVIDPRATRKQGAHALYFDGQSIRIETTAQARGNRPWSPFNPPAHTDPQTGTAIANEEAQ